jgi:hypothetical protein
MSHFRPKDRQLGHGKLIAYRAVDAAIKTSAFGVGPPIQMSVVDGTGVHHLSSDDVKALENSVGGWVELERDTLDNYLREPEPEAQPALHEPPMPEPAMPAATEDPPHLAVIEPPATEPT